MVDGAHNADGVRTLVDSLVEEFPNRRWQVVFGVMGDKNVDAMLEYLKPIADGFIVTTASSDRAVPATQLAERVAAAGIPVVVGEEPEHAVEMARAEAGPEGSVLVTGSLYLVGEVRGLLGSTPGSE